MKALVGAFNQEKALVGAFYVIVKTNVSFAALVVTVHTGAVFAEAGGGVPCLPIPFCSNLRQDPARGRRRWRTAAAPILCLSITVPSAVPAAGQC